MKGKEPQAAFKGKTVSHPRAVKSTPLGPTVLAQEPDRLPLQQAVADPVTAAPSDILALQGAAGNRAVSHLLQAKLTVGPVGDSYEQEADRVAEQVMQMGKRANGQMGAQPGPGVQRQEEEEELQTKPLAASLTPIVQRQEEEEELRSPLARRDPGFHGAALRGRFWRCASPHRR
ncbi:MAG: hypothetical protein P8129_24090 [Anaerolineae bacterium]